MSKITQGIHYSHDGHAPGSLFDLPKKTQKEIYDRYKKQLMTSDMSEEDAIARTDRYFKERALMETILRETAAKKLGEDIVDHPLYFRTDDVNNAWGDKISDTGKYNIDPELLESATFYPGDSFDAMRGTKGDEELLRKELLARLLLINEYNERDGRTLKLKKRKHGNYIEGQLWAPYEIKGNNIVPMKKTSAHLYKGTVGLTKEAVSAAARVMKTLTPYFDQLPVLNQKLERMNVPALRKEPTSVAGLRDLQEALKQSFRSNDTSHYRTALGKVNAPLNKWNRPAYTPTQLDWATNVAAKKEIVYPTHTSPVSLSAKQQQMLTDLEGLKENPILDRMARRESLMQQDLDARATGPQSYLSKNKSHAVDPNYIWHGNSSNLSDTFAGLTSPSVPFYHSGYPNVSFEYGSKNALRGHTPEIEQQINRSLLFTPELGLESESARKAMMARAPEDIELFGSTTGRTGSAYTASPAYETITQESVSPSAFDMYKIDNVPGGKALSPYLDDNGGLLSAGTFTDKFYGTNKLRKLQAENAMAGIQGNIIPDVHKHQRTIRQNMAGVQQLLSKDNINVNANTQDDFARLLDYYKGITDRGVGRNTARGNNDGYQDAYNKIYGTRRHLPVTAGRTLKARRDALMRLGILS